MKSSFRALLYSARRPRAAWITFYLALCMAELVIGSRAVAADASPLTFNFWPVGNLADMLAGNQGDGAKNLGTHVLTAFAQAGELWKAQLADPITVNIEVEFGPQGFQVLGRTESTFVAHPYSEVRAAMFADARSADDAMTVSNLQPGPTFEFITNDTSFDNRPNVSPRIRDNDGSANNSYLSITTANAKALGLAAPGGADATISFSDFSDYGAGNTWEWDFDRSDGISPDDVDFVGVAAHELGHALGFDSGVGIVDLVGSPNFPTPAQGGIGPLDLNPLPMFSVLDLFRYTQDSLSQPNQPPGGLNDLAFGQPAPGDRAFFSLDGGATNLGQFTTGIYNGSGREPGHWRDNRGLGLMDPTVTTGVEYSLSGLDLRAFDVIGYDRNAPEPSSLVIALVGVPGMLGYIGGRGWSRMCRVSG